MSDEYSGDSPGYLPVCDRDTSVWMSLKIAVSQDQHIEESLKHVTDINLKKLLKAEQKRRKKNEQYTSTQTCRNCSQ
jgi:hypothetical protein